MFFTKQEILPDNYSEVSYNESKVLAALMAPGPVYLAVTQDDVSGDSKRAFLAAKYAETYITFSKKELDVDKINEIEEPVGCCI